MYIFTVLVSNVVIGGLCYLIGGNRMKRKLEKGIFKILDDFQSQHKE